MFLLCRNIPVKLIYIFLLVRMVKKHSQEWGHRYDGWPHICPATFSESSLLRSGLHSVSLLHSRNPCQDFQARRQSRGSGGLEACSLVKYLSYVIDVSTVINLAAAHPSSWPVPARLHGGLWRSCQTGSDEVCLCVRLFVETFCFDCWRDYVAFINWTETKSVGTVVCERSRNGDE